MTEPTAPSGADAAIDPRAVDVFEFARHGCCASGVMHLADLPRMLAEVPADAPGGAMAQTPVQWCLHGEMRSEIAEHTEHAEHAEQRAERGAARVRRGEQGAAPGEFEQPYLRLTLAAQIWLECQRCLRPYRQAFDVAVRYRVAASEDEADAQARATLDDDALEVIVGSHRFDLYELVDEELLLSLPLVPKHDTCPEVHESLVSGGGAPGSEESSVGNAARSAPRTAAGEPRQVRPFAALAALRGKAGKTSGNGENN